MKIDVVVVAYRSDPYVARLASDLPRMTANPYRLRLYDNTGRQRNLSAVQNELARQGTGDWILFANGDVLFAPGWDERLVGFLDRHPAFGAALPLPGGDRRYPQFWTRDIPEKYFGEGMPGADVMRRISDRLADNVRHHVYDTESFFCPFFAVLMRRETWTALRGFDERYRLFGGDRDFQSRLHLACGKGVAGVRSIGFYHAGGGSLAEAESRGEIDRKAEWDHRTRVRTLVDRATWARWHDLPAESRLLCRKEPEFSYIGAGAPESGIEGVRIVDLAEIPDARGSLCEIYRPDLFPSTPPAQVNRMVSRARTLRGNHVHRDHSDVFVLASGRATVGLRDVRKSSPTFGAVGKVEMAAAPPRAVVVPPGVVHGVYFREPATLITLETHVYDPAEEAHVAWDDPALGIDYGDPEPVVAAAGADAPSFAAMTAAIEPWQRKFSELLGFVSRPGKARVSVVIPTIDRESLEETLASVEGDLDPDDQVVVVGDGPCPGARARVAARGSRFIYAETPRTGRWGHAQRNLGMDLASGDYVWFLDDDDTAHPGALEAIRREAMLAPGRPMVFRMAYEERIIWERPVLLPGNVSTQMLVVPNVPSRTARWGPDPAHPTGRGGDYLFALRTARLWPPGHLLWRPDVVARLVRHGFGRTGSVTGALDRRA